jgi:hypothetical protein
MGVNSMNRSRIIRIRAARLISLLGLFSILLIFAASSAAAPIYRLNWSQIGFVNGTSTLQEFVNVDDSGVDMTTEFWVLDSNFNQIAHYKPGTTAANSDMPKVGGSAAGGGVLEVRDINQIDFPTAGYIQTQITFSEPISIHDLWLEPFYHWLVEDVLKHAALQAFDEAGNALVPVNWETYGGSSMIVEDHPGNGQPWWRSHFSVGQNTYSGAGNIDYGNQRIKQLNWYSWGLDPDDGTFRHVLGSTLLGDFSFTVMPTAVTLVSLELPNRSVAVGVVPAFLALLAFSLITVGLNRRRRHG